MKGRSQLWGVLVPGASGKTDVWLKALQSHMKKAGVERNSRRGSTGGQEPWQGGSFPLW